MGKILDLSGQQLTRGILSETHHDFHDEESIFKGDLLNRVTRLEVEHPYIRRDLDEVKTDNQKILEGIQSIQSEMRSTQSHFQSEMHGIRTDLQSGLQAVRSELQSDTQETRSLFQTSLQETRSELQSDSQETRSFFRTKLQETHSELQSDIQATRSLFQTTLQESRAETQVDLQTLRSELDKKPTTGQFWGIVGTVAALALTVVILVIAGVSYLQG